MPSVRGVPMTDPHALEQGHPRRRRLKTITGKQPQKKRGNALSGVMLPVLPVVPVVPVEDKSRTIQVLRKEGETEDQAVARMMVRGTVGNASTVIDYSRSQHEGLSLTDIARTLKEEGETVSAGNLGSLERMLYGQAVALNAMFTELARRGALNMGEHVEASERYIRLGLKAQSQARATAETLCAMKNPPVVFARQANISHGPQQVNNGPAAVTTGKEQAARTGESTLRPNELLEDRTHGSPQLDTRATTTASRPHQGLEPVEEVNRPAHR